jgi:UDP-GlcNAc:undecaprenyl-phosphate/decaprenyl-phosphate GlcNAc-1-phosphate transferase
MYSLVFLGLTSLLLGLLLTPLVRDLFLRVGLVDIPDATRKIHTRPIPRVGGIPIAMAYVGACGLLLASPLHAGTILAQHLPLVWKLLPCSALIFLTGFIDDVAGLKPWQKLAGQTAAALAAYAAGVRILGIAGVSTADWWSLPVTVAWLIGCTNAFNLIDGMDGLASGVGLFATLTTLAVALLYGNMALALATAPLAGALLAFLRYNFNPASIFLGDCGSLLIGFLLGCYSVLWSQKASTWLAMTAPLMVLAVPILDVLLAIARRYLGGQPIFAADRGHIHHRLLDRGLTPRRAVIVLYGVCSVGAALSVLQAVAQSRFAAAILIVFCLATAAGVRLLGYAEFDAARRILLGGGLRRVFREEIRLQRLSESIRSAATVHDCWSLLRDAAPAFGFSAIQVRILGETYRSQPHARDPAPAWTLRIPISERDYILCSTVIGNPEHAPVAGRFAGAVASALRLKLPALRPTGSLDPDLAALARGAASQSTAAVAIELSE